MLSELRRALYEAISDSSDVHRTWRRLRDEGYTLYLVVDCKRQSDEDEDDSEASAEEAVRDALDLVDGEPAFQINGGDLSFLRSIGIDPTRRGRRRRSS